MSKYSCLSILFLLFGSQIFAVRSGGDAFTQSKHISFKENKGQVSDQHGDLRNDVLFSGKSGDLVFHLRSNGISYQMFRVDSWKTVPKELTGVQSHRNINSKVPDQTTIYRLDVNWIGAKQNAFVKKQNVLPGYSTYYNSVCPNGITGVKSYGSVEYQNIYDGINLKWYSRSGDLKYDYLISAGADHKQIKLNISGATSITTTKRGELVIETPLGVLKEQAPLVLQEGRELKAKWKVDGATVSFDIDGIDATKPFVIDPLIRLWATYLGGNQNDMVYYSSPDNLGNVYFSGESMSANNIATSGAHQTVFGGGSSGWGDAFVSKFTGAGVNVWTTYYGGNGNDVANVCDVNASGSNIVVVGVTTSSIGNVIATPGSHQPTYAGSGNGWGDAFVVLFDGNGVRQWGTYYGGPSSEWAIGACFDNVTNDIYISGGTSSSVNISTPGSHQPNLAGQFDAFLVKFDVAGNRSWGTYFGDFGSDNGHSCETDQNGDVYLVGQTTSTNNISSPAGSHQPLYGGGTNTGDGFVAKFTSSGNRLWSTYYGGAGDDWMYNCVVDQFGELYVAGTTAAPSASAIATAGIHQSTYGGGTSDAFLVKFNGLGVRQWCTLYGGSGVEDLNYCAIDPSGNLYLSGITNSSGANVISTPCAYQPNLSSGVADAYLVKFTASGQRMWGTYYGGFGMEDWPSCNCDASGNVYLVGSTSTSSASIMTSVGAHQSIYGGGGSDGFIAKFDGCIPTAPANTTPLSNLTVCQGKTTTLTTNTLCALGWYNVPVGGTPLSNASVYNTPGLFGTTTFYIEETTCGTSSIRTPVTVTVVPSPTFSVSASSYFLCPGTSATLTPIGASGGFTWTPDPSLDTAPSSFAIATPPATKVYSVTASDGVCVGTGTVMIAIFPNPTISISTPVVYMCSGRNATLNVQGATNYTWEPSSSINFPNSDNVLASPASNTTYTITGANSFSNVTCYDERTITVYVIPYPTNATVSESVSICIGSAATLTASGGAITTWSPIDNMDDPNAAEVHVRTPVTTTYSVSVSNNGLCPVTRTVLVRVDPVPVIDAGRDTTYNINDAMFIAAVGSGTITWTGGEGIYCKVCPMTQVLPTKYSCYTAETVNEFGCTSVDQICIDVTKDHYIYIPNSFTPNHDGLNDEFKVFGDGITLIKMVVYDRWGHEMYFKEGEDCAWDGTYKGEVCEEGVYLYRFLYRAITGEKIYKMGNLTLLKD